MEKLDIKILKLGYIPAELKLSDFVISENKAILQFLYKENNFYFVQGERMESTSVSLESDQVYVGELIENKWMNLEIEIKENQLKDGIEYGAQFYYKNGYYILSGKMEKNEFIELVKNINFF